MRVARTRPSRIRRRSARRSMPASAMGTRSSPARPAPRLAASASTSPTIAAATASTRGSCGVMAAPAVRVARLNGKNDAEQARCPGQSNLRGVVNAITARPTSDRGVVALRFGAQAGAFVRRQHRGNLQRGPHSSFAVPRSWLVGLLGLCPPAFGCLLFEVEQRFRLVLRHPKCLHSCDQEPLRLILLCHLRIESTNEPDECVVDQLESAQLERIDTFVTQDRERTEALRAQEKLLSQLVGRKLPLS